MDDENAKENFIIDNQNNSNTETPKEMLPMLGNTKIEEIKIEREIGAINDVDTDSDTEPIGKREMNTLLTNLNLYWVEIMATLGLFIFIIIYEIIAFIIFIALQSIIDFNFEAVVELIDALTDQIGVKWFVLIIIFQHLSIGFFCLTTFSNIFHETQDIKKFFKHNSLKVIGFYLLSIFIL